MLSVVCILQSFSSVIFLFSNVAVDMISADIVRHTVAVR